MLISKFDPWKSGLCTCPSKLTFNPYTGCDHSCTYCYASSYIPEFSDCRPKKNLIQRLTREAAGLRGETLSISNSSDPYPNLEAKTELTRSCLKVLIQHDCKIQLITKSPLVVRDSDLLKKANSMVSMTISTLDDDVATLVEPHAPLPSKRLKAVETLIKEGIPTSVRIDPIIPSVNDDVEELVEILASIGVKHVTSSTYKIKPDNWKRFSEAMPETAEKLKPLYFEKGPKMGGSRYLPKGLRRELVGNVRSVAMRHGMRFGVCREGFTDLNTGTCDGSWLLCERVAKLF